MSKIGLGILTYKRPEYFKECIKRIDNTKLDEIVVVNDGTPYDFDIPYHLIQHKTNKGIGVSKNDALKYLQSKNCDYYFLMEDDILIKDNNVFNKYIDASTETGIQHFNYSQHGLMNKKPGTQIPNPRTRIDYKNNVTIDLHMHCVGAFSFYTKECLSKSGLMDDFYFNATEHLDHTYTIIKKGMHPPFWWFADIANSNQYLEDFPWSPETSTISQNSNRNNIIIKSYDHFIKKHGHHILNTPNVSLDVVKEKLKQIYKKINDKFFENFDKVYCINLKHRLDRKANILNECSKHNLGEVEFFEAFDGKQYKHSYPISNGNYGLLLSNIEILKRAKECGYKQIVILEDDCYFTEEIKNINEYLNLLPPDWDMFYLGGNHNIGWNNIPPPIAVNEKIIKLHSTFTTHFVAIKNHMFDILIKNFNTFSYPIDVIYTVAQKKYNVYCTSNTIAKQINGYSDIENRQVDYHNFIK